MKDPIAQDIVADSIRNGDSFKEVEKRLQRKYDQPREVFTEALRGMINIPNASYSRTGLANMVNEFNKFRNILLCYGGGTTDQVFTENIKNSHEPQAPRGSGAYSLRISLAFHLEVCS